MAFFFHMLLDRNIFRPQDPCFYQSTNRPDCSLPLLITSSIPRSTSSSSRIPHSAFRIESSRLSALRPAGCRLPAASYQLLLPAVSLQLSSGRFVASPLHVSPFRTPHSAFHNGFAPGCSALNSPPSSRLLVSPDLPPPCSSAPPRYILCQLSAALTSKRLRHALCAWCFANGVNYTLVYLYRVSYPHTNSGLRALSCVHLAHLVPRLTSLRITFHLFQPLNFLVTYEISMPRFICPSVSVFRVVRSCIPGMAFASQSGTGAFDCSVLPVFAREETTPQTDC